MKIENPYEGIDSNSWLRGNLHAHTTASDGRSPIQDVINAYATLGHDFLMISDHDILTNAEDHAKLDNRGLILIPGNEVTRDGPHLLHVGADRLVEPSADRQLVIDTVNAGAGFVVMNHPNWTQDFNHCPFEQLAELENYLGLEIFNGVITRLDGSPYATDKWDRLLTRGRRLWGLANDDSHLPVQDVGLGWNVVNTKERTIDGILSAMRKGSFYASTGVTITAIEVAGNRIRVETENADRILVSRQYGQEFARADASAIDIEVPAKTKYVRIECLGRGGRAAWTQPFYISAE